jgi:glycosyltransferase involved in cell wall biosynthesis
MMAHEFPPAAGVGAIRPAKFAQYLPEFGWRVVVLTRTASREACRSSTLLARVVPHAEIHRVPSLAYGSFARAARDELSSPEHDGSFRRRLAGALRDSLLVPDSSVLWWPFALPRALRLSRRGVDALYATAPPFGSLVLGRRVQQVTGLPLVSDFRDPWVHSFEDYRTGERASRLAAERRMEAAVVRGSAAIVVTSPEYRDEMRALHAGVDAARFHCVTNGYDEADFRSVEPHRFEGIAIVMTGKWVPEYEPEIFLRAFAEFCRERPIAAERLTVHVVGHVLPRYREEVHALGLDARFRFHGVLDPVSTLSYQLGADALLLLLNRDAPRRIPAKTFEYLYAGAPVLALVAPGGATARVIERSGAGSAADPSDRASVHALLENLANARPESPEERERSRAARRLHPEITKFERRHLARELAGILDAIVPRRVTN